VTFGPADYQLGGRVPESAPWHTREDYVHHANTECLHSRLVEVADRQPGTGGKPLCKVCEVLNRADREDE
jgi:hypothetical protein